jgi:hypothetical protein
MRFIPQVLSVTCALVLCLLATPIQSASADNSRWSEKGLTARAGTSVGHSEVANARWSTLGGHVAVGYQLGPFTLEGEYERNQLLHYTGRSNRTVGEHKRFGANARFYFANVANQDHGKTKILLFGEGSLGWQRGRLADTEFERKDQGVGFGWLLDHKVRRLDNRLKSVGWHVGWRITNSTRPNEAMARMVCGKHCPMEEPLPDTVDIGLTMSSSLSLHWR